MTSSETSDANRAVSLIKPIPKLLLGNNLSLVSVLGNAVQLQGQSNFKVLINDRTSISNSNLADILKGMAASNIERIEIITIPPAKYDAEGFGGIIIF